MSHHADHEVEEHDLGLQHDVGVLRRRGLGRRGLPGAASGIADGVPLTLWFRLLDVSGDSTRPLAGAALYAWHCEHAGDYSMYDGDAVEENYLRGVQASGADGWLEYTTLFADGYSLQLARVSGSVEEGLVAMVG